MLKISKISLKQRRRQYKLKSNKKKRLKDWLNLRLKLRPKDRPMRHNASLSKNLSISVLLKRMTNWLKKQKLKGWQLNKKLLEKQNKSKKRQLSKPDSKPSKQ